MSNKHFEKLAAALKASKPYKPNFIDRARYNIAMAQWVRDVKEITDTCADMDHSFRRSTFLDACGFSD